MHRAFAARPGPPSAACRDAVVRLGPAAYHARFERRGRDSAPTARPAAAGRVRRPRRRRMPCGSSGDRRMVHCGSQSRSAGAPGARWFPARSRCCSWPRPPPLRPARSRSRGRRSCRRRTSTSRSWRSTTSTATSSRPPGSSGRVTLPDGTTVNAGGVEYLATHVRNLEATNRNIDRRLGRRPHRRQPAPVGAVPRRADDRGDEPDRPRLQRRRQPRVRRGRGRAPADAERRLPPGRRLPRRRRLRRRRLPLPRRQRRLRDDRQDALPGLQDPQLRRARRSRSSAS